jgi:hypothetical protein
MDLFMMEVDEDDVNDCSDTTDLSAGYPVNYFIEVNQFFDFANDCELTTTPSAYNIYNKKSYISCMMLLNQDAEFSAMDSNGDLTVTEAEAETYGMTNGCW